MSRKQRMISERRAARKPAADIDPDMIRAMEVERQQRYAEPEPEGFEAVAVELPSAGRTGWRRTWRFGTETLQAALAHPLKGHPQYLRPAALQPDATGVLDLVPVSPHREGSVKVPREDSYDVTASGTPYGTAAPVADLAFEADTETLGRIPISATVHRDVLEDAGVGADSIVGSLRQRVRRGVSGEIISGDGTDDSLLGILNVTGTHAIDASTLDPVAALAQAAAEVHGEGFEAPLQAVGNPATLWRDVFGDAARQVRAALPGIDTYLPSVHLPAGTVIVGAFGEAAELIAHELNVAVYPQHGSNATLGAVTLLAGVRAHLWTKHAPGFAVVSNVS
jgi:hypothetical protein